MIKQIFLNISQLGRGNWWVEIITKRPFCIYYFGPFANVDEAEKMRPGYVDDLIQEGVDTMRVLVRHCQPTQLTIFEDNAANYGFEFETRLECS